MCKSIHQCAVLPKFNQLFSMRYIAPDTAINKRMKDPIICVPVMLVSSSSSSFFFFFRNHGCRMDRSPCPNLRNDMKSNELNATDAQDGAKNQHSQNVQSQQGNIVTLDTDDGHLVNAKKKFDICMFQKHRETGIEHTSHYGQKQEEPSKDCEDSMKSTDTQRRGHQYCTTHPDPITKIKKITDTRGCY